MNAELKALLTTLFATIKVVEDLVVKQSLTKMIPDLEAIALTIPGITANWSDLGAELKALATPGADEDLVAFVLSAVPGVASENHARLIIDAAVNLVAHLGSDAYNLIQAIRTPA